jgi:hypothetical protein
MKRAASLAFAAIFAASALPSMTYYALELRGGSRIFSLDAPVRKGRVLLFHRFPDRVYMSVSAAEVERVVASEDAPKPEKLAPGQTVFIGPAVEGPRYEAPPSVTSPDMVVDGGSDYGYGGFYWGGYVLPPPRPPIPPVVVPSRIGPNGFPIIAPPGTPGSVPSRIGTNGYPILSPQPSR